LAAAECGGVEVAQQDARAGDGGTRVDFQAREFFE
jgi:hypothetical protein